MKVADAIKLMSKLPLQRIVDSFTKDFPKPDEDQARDIILRNVEELTDGKRITAVLQFDGPFKDQIRQILMLEAFVNRPDWSASEQDIVQSLSRLEQDVLDAAEAEDSLRYEDPERIEILKDVLRAARRSRSASWRTLRDSLAFGDRLRCSQLDHFPQPGNILHTPTNADTCRAAVGRPRSSTAQGRRRALRSDTRRNPGLSDGGPRPGLGRTHGACSSRPHG